MTSLWIFMFLCVSLPAGSGLTSFPDNLVVVQFNHTVTLTCPASSAGPVTWTLDRGWGPETLEEEPNYQVRGRTLTLSGFEHAMVGTYRCWEGGTLRDSASVLLDARWDEEGEERTESFLSCRAKSYDCSFTCSWNQSDFTAVRLGLGSACRENKDSCSWISPDKRQGPEGEAFDFTINHSISAHSEESAALLVTAEAINSEVYLRETKQFYLRDIVQPDSPQEVKCRVEKQRLRVTVEPPPTWATPISFFPLEHQIEYLYKDNGKVESSTSDLVPKEISQLRVRSRDPLVPSPWSQWSAWKNVQTKHKKKGDKRKSKDKNTVQCGRSRRPKTGGERRTKAVILYEVPTVD